MKDKGIIYYLSKIPDKRGGGGRRADGLPETAKGKVAFFRYGPAGGDGIDFGEFPRQFQAWAKESAGIKPGERVSIDGKAIGGTLKHQPDSRQDFVNLVSVFAY